MNPLIPVVLTFLILLVAWVTVPAVPAWLTFRITPNQDLGLRGPFKGLTIRAGGAFAAYLIVFVAVSFFVTEVASGIMAQALGVNTWTIAGDVKLFDSEGNPLAEPPDLSRTAVRLVPEPHFISPDAIRLTIPMGQGVPPFIFLDIPAWGGGEIRLTDPRMFEEDPLKREIRLKDVVILRQKPATAATLGPTLAGGM